jgi:hypothetical protein
MMVVTLAGVLFVRCPAPPGGDDSMVTPASTKVMDRQAVQAATTSREAEPVEDPFASALPVGGDVKAPTLVHSATPESPTGAKCRGLVLARLVIDESGKVVHAKDITPGPDEFTAAIVDSFRRSTFRPATKAGVPVRVQFHLSSQIKCSR